jgi:hypothetical protein
MTFWTSVATTSKDSKASQYAGGTNSILEITSMLFSGRTIKFLAFLTDMSQTFTSTWNSENLFGRNDPVGIFQGTVRVVNLSFDVVAGEVQEAALNAQKIEALISFLYPSYKLESAKLVDETGMAIENPPKGASYMYGSPLVRVKFANLIDNNLGGGGKGLLGWIGGLSVNPVLDHGTFVNGGAHYPKAFTLSFDLNVLHDQTPGWDQNGNWLGETMTFGSNKPEGITGGDASEEYGNSPLDPDAETDPFGVEEMTAEPSGPLGPEL